MCMGVLSAYVSIYHLLLVFTEARKGHRMPWNISDIYEPTCACLELNSWASALTHWTISAAPVLQHFKSFLLVGRHWVASSLWLLKFDKVHFYQLFNNLVFVYALFCYCNRHNDQKQLQGLKGLFGFHFQLNWLIEGSQGRKLRQKSWRNMPYWFTHRLVLS